jgi:homoserine dehydrogenase
MAPPVVRLGLIGHGTVGSAFAEEVLARQEELSRRAHATLCLTQIAVRRPERLRHHPVFIHDDARALAADPSVDIVVETSGEPRAAEWLRVALERGASVVTANKLAVARDDVLLAALARREPRLRCEGAVAGAAPVVAAFRQSLAAEEIVGIRGVLNATTTFILSRLEQGRDFSGALSDAQRGGVCEADPRDDLSGADAAAKLAILSSIAWGAPFHADHVATEGVDAEGAAARIRRAPRGFRVRLVAQARRERGEVLARVFPAAVAPNDALYAATGITSVVEVHASLAGPLTWAGTGAGGRATASAVLADTIAAAGDIARLRRRIAA